MHKNAYRHSLLLLLLLAAVLLFATGLTAGASEVIQTRTEGIDAFPESYKPYLQALQEAHPSWRFVAFDTGLTWDEVLDGETRVVDNNLVRIASVSSWKSLAPGAFDWETSTFTTFDGNRYNGASREIIAYYMDPRNSLGQLRYVFQFEQLTFDPNTQTEAGVKAILKGTFMKDDTLLPGFSSAEEEGAMTYAQAFMAIAAELNVSPYHLAARVRQEQGSSGSSALISGTYEGYEGYYNYFNVKASGSTQTDIIVNGLKKAKSEGWDTAYKSLLGGAKLIADKYIAKGQDTLYLEKFDVAAQGGMYDHQYMQNLSAAYSESISVYNSYNNMGMLNGSFTFVIPVYRNMPETACPQPTADGNPNYKLQSLGITETVITPEYHHDTLTYLAAVGNEVHTITVNALPYASTSTVSGHGRIPLTVGTNNIAITVTAERGDTCTYTLQVTRLADGETIIAMGTTTAEVNLRSGPGAEHEILTTVPADRTISILAEKNGWYQVIYGEHTGYISKDHLDVYIPAKGLSLNYSELSVIVGAPMTLTAITDPNPCDSPILWKTSNAAVATVENGVVTGHTTGTATITVFTDNGLSATCAVTVSEPVLFEGTVKVKEYNKLNVRPQPSTSSTALGGLSNGTRVTVVEVLEEWLRILYNDSTAWVSRAYVTPDPVEAHSVTVTPATGILAPGQTLHLTAALTPFYSTETISWSSSDPAVATVENGVVTGVDNGEAIITVTTSGGKTAACTITVARAADSVTLDQTQVSMNKGDTLTLTATMSPADALETLTWESSDETVVTVANGLVTAVGKGSANITVITTSGKLASCAVTVVIPATEVMLDQSALTIPLYESATLTATMTPADSTDTLTWSSSDAAVVTVEGGVINTVGKGTAAITVTTASGKMAACAVTVTDPVIRVTLDQGTITMNPGETATLTPTLSPAGITDALTWSSSDAAVATVENGVIIAVSKGTATITATTTSGQMAVCQVTVKLPATAVQLDQAELTLMPGDTATLTATTTPADSTDALTWSSSDTAVATVENGVVTGVSKGTATITVTTTSGQTAVCQVTVTRPAAEISLNKNDITLVLGESTKLTATITPADSTDALTWNSSDEKIFTVKDGTITTAGVGKATLTVSARDGVQATCIIRVKSPVPDKVTSSVFTVQDGIIRKIPLGTTVSQLLEGLKEKQYCKLYSDESEVNGEKYAATGMVVKLLDGSTVKASYTLVVTGDVNGDGELSITDMIAVKSHILGKSTLSGVAAAAADTNGDGEISITDFIQIKSHILGKSQVQAR